MLICLECFLDEEPEQRDLPFSEWQLAPKLYDECSICRRRTLCAELE
jgi:hypothetical protein